ncbi:MAG: AAA family ATPase [Candidatus Hodarchaeales archaeon]
MSISEASNNCKNIVTEINNFIVGKGEVIEKVMIALLADGHILFEDFPGLAKTMLTKLFAQSIGADFKRIQFTPDLLPADITGAYIFDLKNQEFILRKGPIFTQIVLADEINRAPPKTQSALLESMQEYQVTIEGQTFMLDTPFWVIATQNPIELEGTFGLPEAQMDRFLVRLRVGYPSETEEIKILDNRIKRKHKDMNITKAIINPIIMHDMQQLVEEINIVPDLLSYITRIVQATREHPKLEIGVSPRGSLALLQLSRASALYHGRNYVTPEDIKTFVLPALAHRVILKTGEWLGGLAAESIIRDVITKVVAPRKDIELTV